VQTISPARELPGLRGPGIIDGTTQPGFAGSPIIELEGSKAGLAAAGLRIGSDSTVKGLVINGFDSGLWIGSNNRVVGNYIGTDVTGAIALGNGRQHPFGGLGGIVVTGSNNVIGGTDHDPGVCNRDCNLISANATQGILIDRVASGNRVLGNFMGTDITGTVTDPDGIADSGDELGNAVGVVIVGAGATGNTIGGTTPGERNIISGSWWNHVRFLDTTGNEVLGNYMGTDVTGTLGLGAGFSGVWIVDSSGNTIGGMAGTKLGGPCTGACNVIAGSGAYGVLIEADRVSATGNTVQGNFIGVDVTGTQGIGNGGGIKVEANGNNVRGNVVSASTGVGPISGLGNGVVIVGDENDLYRNRIGTDVNGVKGLGNLHNGVLVRGNRNCIGTLREFLQGKCETSALTDEPDQANVISGNGAHGVVISEGEENIILFNTIGTDLNHEKRLSNLGSGVVLSASNNYVLKNTIGGNAWHGVEVTQGNNNIIQGNFIGTDGTRGDLGNLGSGVLIADGNRNEVGGPPPVGSVMRANNVISGNFDGIVVIGGEENKILENFIGLNQHGDAAIPNQGNGVHLMGTILTTIEENFISGNGAAGVRISEGGNNELWGNSIGIAVPSPERRAGVARAVPNGGPGVEVLNSTENRIGLRTGGNIISGNQGAGILIRGGELNVVEANRIGTDREGTTTEPNLGNLGAGIEVTGGIETDICDNIIGGNHAHGILLRGDATLTTLFKNAIGTNGCHITNTLTELSLPNALDGVHIADSASDNEIGSNCIWFNGRDGVRVDGPNAVSNWITRNSIHANQGKGIENMNGGNEELPPPEGSLVLGKLVGTTCGECLVEIFSDPDHQGQVLWIWGYTDANGSFTASVGRPPSPGRKFTCTATDRVFNTSEFGCGFEAPPVDLEATKRDADVDGGALLPGDLLEYAVQIANNSDVTVPDTVLNELEDPLPQGTSYVPESITVDGVPNDDDIADGTGYEAEANRVVWNGAIPGNATRVIAFRVQLDPALQQGAEVSNQGMVLGLLKTDDPDTPEVDDPTTSVLSAGWGSITGTLYLQGRPDHSGASVQVNGSQTQTGINGSYSFEQLPEGTYNVTASMPGHLPAEKADVEVIGGKIIPVPDVILLAGDFDQNGVIDIYDLVAMAAVFGMTEASADINADGLVDIFDLVLVGMNFGKTESPWKGEPTVQ